MSTSHVVNDVQPSALSERAVSSQCTCMTAPLRCVCIVTDIQLEAAFQLQAGKCMTESVMLDVSFAGAGNMARAGAMAG